MTGQRFHVLGVSGSLRSHSFNTTLLHATQELLPEEATSGHCEDRRSAAPQRRHSPSPKAFPTLSHAFALRWPVPMFLLCCRFTLIHSRCKLLSQSGNIRSNFRPARPYMDRLRVFNLLIWPSVCPLFQGSRTAFRTALLSCRIVMANRCMAWMSHRRASISQFPMWPPSPRETEPRNRIAR